jgi:carbon storage regulator
MLVLSRQRDESIMIGDNVEIVIVDIRGDKVRLGITAPKEIPVHRKEIYLAIQREKAKKKEEEEKKAQAQPEKQPKKQPQDQPEEEPQDEPEEQSQQEPEDQPEDKPKKQAKQGAHRRQ